MKLSSESCNNKDLWVTSCVPLQGINKIAVCLTSKEIGMCFYWCFTIHGSYCRPYLKHNVVHLWQHNHDCLNLFMAKTCHVHVVSDRGRSHSSQVVMGLHSLPLPSLSPFLAPLSPMFPIPFPYPCVLSAFLASEGEPWGRSNFFDCYIYGEFCSNFQKMAHLYATGILLVIYCVFRQDACY